MTDKLASSKANWPIYTGNRKPQDVSIPEPPPWRQYHHNVSPNDGYYNNYGEADAKRAKTYIPSKEVVKMVNAAIFLRRPLLVEGKPGSGKSSLAYSIACELKLGPVLRWNITSRSTRSEGLYAYDVLTRLHDYQLQQNSGQNIGDYFKLGPLGTAMLPTKRPRVLLIDELDKADIDLPNDLLHVLEEGTFEIDELKRESKVDISIPTTDGTSATICNGLIECSEFPIVIMTSNGERDFPLPFLRRCLRLYVHTPDEEQLKNIVLQHFSKKFDDPSNKLQLLIKAFVESNKNGTVATDQLLNAVYMTFGENVQNIEEDTLKKIQETLMQSLQDNIGPVQDDNSK